MGRPVSHRSAPSVYPPTRLLWPAREAGADPQLEVEIGHVIEVLKVPVVGLLPAEDPVDLEAAPVDQRRSLQRHLDLVALEILEDAVGEDLVEGIVVARHPPHQDPHPSPLREEIAPEGLRSG